MGDSDLNKPNLDERSLLIIQFIKQKPGCTYNEVSKVMEKEHICADMTTLSRLKDLVDFGILEDRRMGKGFHRLFINEKSQFNRIYKQLVIFDKVLEDTTEFVKRYLQLFDHSKDLINEGNIQDGELLKKYIFDILDNFTIPFGRIGEYILHVLLFQTFQNVRNENYRRILNDKIVYQMLMMDSVTSQIRPKKIPSNYVDKIQLFLNDPDRRDLFMKYNMNISLLRSSVDMISDFSKEFERSNS